MDVVYSASLLIAVVIAIDLLKYARELALRKRIRTELAKYPGVNHTYVTTSDPREPDLIYQEPDRQLEVFIGRSRGPVSPFALSADLTRDEFIAVILRLALRGVRFDQSTTYLRNAEIDSLLRDRNWRLVGDRKTGVLELRFDPAKLDLVYEQVSRIGTQRKTTS